MNIWAVAYIILAMAIKIVERKYIEEILEALGLEAFVRPYAGLIDPGDFGAVATYIPLYPEEYKQLPPQLQRHVYLIAENRYGLICFLPRLFDTPDRGKVTGVTRVFNHWHKLLKVVYYTDKGGEFETVHTIRQDKLLAQVKRKKLPDNVRVVAE